MMTHTAGEDSTKDTARFLYEACRDSNVQAFVRLDDRLEFSVERLGSYLDGEIEWNGVYRPLPRGE